MWPLAAVFSTNWRLLSFTFGQIPENLIGQAYFSSKATKTIHFCLVSGCTLFGQVYSPGLIRLSHFTAWMIRCEELWAGSQTAQTCLVHKAIAATLTPMFFIFSRPCSWVWHHSSMQRIYLQPPDQMTSLTCLSYVSLLDITMHLQKFSDKWIYVSALILKATKCPCNAIFPRLFHWCFWMATNKSHVFFQRSSCRDTVRWAPMFHTFA